MSLRNTWKPALVCALLGLAVSGAQAQDLPNAKTAHKMLFKTGKRATVVRILQPDMVPEVYKGALKNAASIQKYFEAMAASPSEGFMASSASHAINFHTVEAAHAAAISGCNAKKKKGSKPCVVVADFVPKGYSAPRDFSLSAVASEEFSKKYRRKGNQKAYAISPSTGHWGNAIKAGSLEEARTQAIADCTAKAAKTGAKDCAVVSEN